MDNLRKHGWRDSAGWARKTAGHGSVSRTHRGGGPPSPVFSGSSGGIRVLRTPEDDAIHTRMSHFVFVVIRVPLWHSDMCSDCLALQELSLAVGLKKQMEKSRLSFQHVKSINTHPLELVDALCAAVLSHVRRSSKPKQLWEKHNWDNFQILDLLIHQ